jgi:hypothetical protein
MKERQGLSPAASNTSGVTPVAATKKAVESNDEPEITVTDTGNEIDV